MVTMNNEDVYQNVAIHGFQQQSDASQPQIQNNAKSNDFFQECALKFIFFDYKLFSEWSLTRKYDSF